MAKFRIRPASIKNVKANLKAYTLKKQRHIALALAFWGDDTIAEIQAEIGKLAFDQGILQAATTRTPVELSGTRLKTTIFNPMEYATVIEFGRKPGKMPPLLPLVAWAARKGIVTHLPRNIAFGGDYAKEWAASAAIMRNMKRGRSSSKRNPKPMDPIVHDLLIIRLIAKKIMEKGSAGKHPFSIAWDRRAKTFRRDVAAAVRSLG